jgi:2-polyprenyl-6-methoxyphenol hydroxylase-like FAD-dependent oxidoreductase
MGWSAIGAGIVVTFLALLWLLHAREPIKVTVIEKTSPLRHGGERPMIWKTYRVEI